jgi:hypothetical protein
LSLPQYRARRVLEIVPPNAGSRTTICSPDLCLRGCEVPRADRRIGRALGLRSGSHHDGVE